MFMPCWPEPGTIIYVWFLCFFKHRGIIVYRDGRPWVIANAEDTNGVRELPLARFANERPWFIEGYPSKLVPCEVIYNARGMIGTPYSLLAFNCDHFVYKCHGLPPSSPQVAAVVALSVLGMTALAGG